MIKDRDMDIEHIGDIYKDLEENKFPRRIMSIYPNVNDLEDLPNEPEDTKEESTQG